MPNLQFLTPSANGKQVFFDPVYSHAATHFADTPELKELVVEVLARTPLSDDRLFFDTDMQRIVGSTDLVENDESDTIVFAKRKNRDTYTSFNKTKVPKPCSVVAIRLEKIDETSYMLLSAWVGTMNSPPFPGGKNETSESKSYWLKHSLAWGRQEIQEGTETTACPW